MQNKQALRFGLVLRFNKDQGTGLVKVHGEPVEAEISANSRRELAEGPAGLEFSGVPGRYLPPRRDAQVVCHVSVEYRRRQEEGRITLRRHVRVTAWEYLFAFKDAQKEMERSGMNELAAVLESTSAAEMPAPVAVKPVPVQPSPSLIAVVPKAEAATPPSRIEKFNARYGRRDSPRRDVVVCGA